MFQESVARLSENVGYIQGQNTKTLDSEASLSNRKKNKKRKGGKIVISLYLN